MLALLHIHSLKVPSADRGDECCAANFREGLRQRRELRFVLKCAHNRTARASSRGTDPSVQDVIREGQTLVHRMKCIRLRERRKAASPSRPRRKPNPSRFCLVLTFILHPHIIPKTQRIPQPPSTRRPHRNESTDASFRLMDNLGYDLILP